MRDCIVCILHLTENSFCTSEWGTDVTRDYKAKRALTFENIYTFCTSSINLLSILFARERMLGEYRKRTRYPTEKSGSGADAGSYAGICARTYVGNVFGTCAGNVVGTVVGIWDRIHRRAGSYVYPDRKICKYVFKINS